MLPPSAMLGEAVRETVVVSIVSVMLAIAAAGSTTRLSKFPPEAETMVAEIELTTAVDLHRRAYQLLLWVERAIREGRIRFDQIHQDMSAVAAAQQWVWCCYSSFPTNFRPREKSSPQLEQFANLLASYLMVSFDLVEEPGRNPRLCPCSFCQHLVSFARLRAKKLTMADKQRAQELIREYLGRLASELRRPLTDADIDELLQDRTVREKAAMSTYGEQLIRRMHDDPTDPSTLALWRMFAWEPTGSPKHDFELSASDILRAEQELAEIMRPV